MNASWYELHTMLPELKKELPWLKTDCYSQVLQSVTKNLEQAMKNWFEGRAKITQAIEGRIKTVTRNPPI